MSETNDFLITPEFRAAFVHVFEPRKTGLSSGGSDRSMSRTFSSSESGLPSVSTSASLREPNEILMPGVKHQRYSATARLTHERPQSRDFSTSPCSRRP